MESKVDSFTVELGCHITSRIFDAICEVLVYCLDTALNCNDPTYIPYIIYCFSFTVKKFCGLIVSIPEKLSGFTLDDNTHGKIFAVTKQSMKNAKPFTGKQKQYIVYLLLLLYWQS